MQNRIQLRLEIADAAFVFDKPWIADATHNQANARAGDAEHLRQRFLRNIRNEIP